MIVDQKVTVQFNPEEIAALRCLIDLGVSFLDGVDEDSWGEHKDLLQQWGRKVLKEIPGRQPVGTLTTSNLKEILRS